MIHRDIAWRDHDAHDKTLRELVARGNIAHRAPETDT